MISGRGSPPAWRQRTAASAIARTCKANRPGISSPSRTPRRPSIGFCSCSRRTAASSEASPSVTGWPVAAATPSRTESSVRSGRNSCSGGSIRRTVTGSPSIAVKIATKSSRWSGRRSSRAACLASSSSARMSRSTSCLRSPRNMCSVRHSPMPAAPNRRARSASSAVSALARTPSRRASSAWVMIRCTASTSGSLPSASNVPSKYWTTGEGTTGTSPR